MSDRSLTLKRSDLERYYARDRGMNPQRTDWDATQQADCDMVIGQALRWVYYPQALEGEGSVHLWTFLKPIGRISTVANQGDYDLPDDFGGIDGSITYDRDETFGTFDIRIVPEQKIRSLRQSEDSNLEAVGYPELAAIVPQPTNGTEAQRFTLMLWPIPQQSFDLTYTYESNPLLITGDAPYPAGGQPLSEAILAAVLAAAESYFDGEKGVRWAEFVIRLKAAVHYDRKARGPQFLGMFGDGRTSSVNNRFHPHVTFEGVRY